MPYINDNFDDLFKKAANDYPLKTSSSNWNKVANKLQAYTKETAVAKKRIYKYSVITLLLLATSAVIYLVQFKAATTNQANNLHSNITTQSKLTSPKSNTPATTNNNLQAPLNTKTDLGLANVNSATKSHLPVVENTFSQTNNSIHSTKINSQISVVDFSNLNPIKNNIAEDLQQRAMNLHSNLNSIKNDVSENVTQSIQVKNSLPETKIADAATNQNIINSATNSKSTKAAKHVIKLSPVFSRLYGSLYAGPEFSTVKFQHIDKPGYKIGVALGYRISTKFSAELGLQREHINFYSNGKYFDRSKLKLRPNTFIESLTGSGKLTSVPVTLKYNFLSPHNGHFFVAAGINAVVITHTENYTYAVIKDGSEGDRSKNFGSPNKPEYFTGMNASAGYETKLSNWCDVKFEPYYQGQINSFGRGKLPVSNFGINVGIVKNLK